MPGITRTMSSGIYLEREVSADTAYALSAILIALAVLLLAAAGVPSLLRRHREAVARTLSPMNTESLRALTAPVQSPREVSLVAGPHDVTFRGGAITAVVGPNGAGKTTLMRFLSGRLRGATVSADRVVMLTQNPGLPPTATVRQAPVSYTHLRAHET